MNMDGVINLVDVIAGFAGSSIALVITIVFSAQSNTTSFIPTIIFFILLVLIYLLYAKSNFRKTRYKSRLSPSLSVIMFLVGFGIFYAFLGILTAGGPLINLTW